MNNRQFTAVGIFYGSFVLGIVGFVFAYDRRRQKIREQIRLDVEAELEAIRLAGETVQENIRLGKYDGRGLAPVLNDLQFYRITNRFDN